ELQLVAARAERGVARQRAALLVALVELGDLEVDGGELGAELGEPGRARHRRRGLDRVPGLADLVDRLDLAVQVNALAVDEDELLVEALELLVDHLLLAGIEVPRLRELGDLVPVLLDARPDERDLLAEEDERRARKLLPLLHLVLAV